MSVKGKNELLYGAESLCRQLTIEYGHDGISVICLCSAVGTLMDLDYASPAINVTCGELADKNCSF